ncbi:MAG: divalent-cation tolerance protein CutA [Micavibrio aeruginosavorus]|uniref:Divalent-cation tolerance protein CutA n=1 Tax=Micavibrio aeruginosavorus TaxID=349221 RepID=A0A2W5PLT9_9BACT|nr:MAG: divalent-cation tolerance protein CutA [Micavibrio aeruginosavorus]
MSSNALFVYVTCPDMDVAKTIVRGIVEKRLAACANILPNMTSFYWWDEKVQEADEVVVIFKTTKDSWPELCEALKAVHPYEVPCIVALPIESGYEPYLTWIGAETLPV